MMTNKIEKYITNRNEWLLPEVKKKYKELNFIFTKEAHARVLYQGEKATIYLPEDSFSEECITHELLHLYIETKENIVYCLLMGLIRENANLKLIFSNDLIEHMTNCLHHIKMLPIFIQMGYDKANFLADSFLNKCEIDFAKRIKRRFKFLGKYNKTAIDIYIGKYFAMKTDVSEIDYSRQLNIMFETDKALYTILQNFWTKWLSFNIYSTDTIDYWSDNFAGEFIDSLEVWIKEKKIK
jgi:hypothetical protein